VQYKTADFHKEIFHITEDDSIEQAVIVSFRGSAKSTICATSMPIWAILGKLQKKYIVLISRTKEQSRLILSNIKDELENNTEKAKQIFASAVMNAKLKGSMPGGLERYVKDLLEPKIPWRNRLSKHIKNAIDPHDWTYRRAHRKSHSLGIFMPSVLKENIDMEVVVDVSGSVGAEDYKEFISELYSIMSVFKNIKIYLTFIDCAVTDEFELRGTEKNKLLNMTPKGGGGTDMELAFNHIEKQNRNSKLLICFTDGYTRVGDRGGNYPFNIIWTICSDGMSEEAARNHFNYGDIIKM
jgi:predicted metal-dependent peptidase